MQCIFCTGNHQLLRSLDMTMKNGLSILQLESLESESLL